MNWRVHVKHRLALGHHRMRTMARIMTANEICRKLAHKAGWAVAMSTAAYGIEAICEGQAWLLEGFNRLTTAIGRSVAGVGILDMISSRTTMRKHDEVHGLSPYHCHRGLTTPNLATAVLLLRILPPRSYHSDDESRHTEMANSWRMVATPDGEGGESSCFLSF
jgi:hypothetical protein